MKHRIQKLFVASLFVAVLSSCRTNHGRAGAPVAAKLFADYYEERFKLYPMEATQAGDPRYNDLLPDNLTESFRASERAFYRKYLAGVTQLERGQISPEDRMSCEILKWNCKMELKQLEF